MTQSRAYKFEACQALTPDGHVVSIPKGEFLVVGHTGVVSIAVRGRILDITQASFELLLLDHKATESDV